MNSADFLKLIEAPWAAFHDHPFPETAPSIAFIRPVGTEYSEQEIATVYNVDSGVYGAMRSAARDLIVQAPDMYAYVARMAQSGDTEAKILMQKIHRGEQ